MTITYLAWNFTTQTGQIGDATNHTLKLIKNGAETSPSATPSEVDSTLAPGTYSISLSPSEFAGFTTLCGKSSTNGVSIIPETFNGVGS